MSSFIFDCEMKTHDILTCEHMDVYDVLFVPTTNSVLRVVKPERCRITVPVCDSAVSPAAQLIQRDDMNRSWTEAFDWTEADWYKTTTNEPRGFHHGRIMWSFRNKRH